MDECASRLVAFKLSLPNTVIVTRSHDPHETPSVSIRDMMHRGLRYSYTPYYVLLLLSLSLLSYSFQSISSRLPVKHPLPTKETRYRSRS